MTRQLLIKKVAVMSMITGMLAVFLYVFYLNEHVIRNFQPYYASSYIVSIEYQLQNVRRLVNSFLGTDGPSISKQALEVKNAVSIPVLLYHGIVPTPREDETIGAFDVTLDDFKAQMFALKQSGWETVSIYDYLKWRRGEIELPERSMLITFDDGRKDSYYPVDPILSALDYRATMFAIARVSIHEKNNYYLTADELRRMISSGRWDVQSHGYENHREYPIDGDGNGGHFFSNRLWVEGENRWETVDEYRNRIFQDFVNAKKALSEELGAEQVSFAAPFGDIGQDTENFVEAGKHFISLVSMVYPITFFQIPHDGYRFTASYQTPPNIDDSFLVRRIEVRRGWSTIQVLEALEGGLAKSLPFATTFPSKQDWIRAWGDLELEPGGLKVSAAENTTGAIAILDGSRMWQDYAVRALVDWRQGNSINIIGRYQSDLDFAACNFGKDFAHVEQTVNGERRVIKGARPAPAYPAGDFDVAMEIKGRTVRCLVENQIVVETNFLDPELFNGGVGFKTWDSAAHTSELVIREVLVEAL